MARSHTIYIVMEKVPSPPVNAFTVKHELISWLKGQVDPHDHLTVYKTRDNADGEATRIGATEVPMDELIGTPAQVYLDDQTDRIATQWEYKRDPDHPNFNREKRPSGLF